MQISTVLRVFIIPAAVVYAELYFLYFIFLTEFSAAASCAAPASTSLAVENSLLIFILLVFNLTQFYFAVKDDPGWRRLSCDSPSSSAQPWFALEREMLLYATSG